MAKVERVPIGQVWSEYDDPQTRDLMRKVLDSRIFKDACASWQERARECLGKSPASPFDNDLLHRFGESALRTIASLPVTPAEVNILGRYAALAFLLFSGRGSAQFGEALDALLAKPEFRKPDMFVEAVDLLYVATLDTNAGSTLYPFLSGMESGTIESMFDLHVWAGTAGDQYCAERQRILAASYLSLAKAAEDLRDSATKRKEAVLSGKRTKGSDNFARLDKMQSVAQTINLLEALLTKDAERAKADMPRRISGT